MSTVYHFNHGFKSCQPGDCFRMLPTVGNSYCPPMVADGFPAGLSTFGARHLIPEHAIRNFIGDPTFAGLPEEPKKEMEFHLEQVRRNHFPARLSRYQAFFAFSSLEGAHDFLADIGASDKRDSIWEVHARCIDHTGDMRLLLPERYTLEDAMAYWRGEANASETPVWECLVPLPVTMIRCLSQPA